MRKLSLLSPSNKDIQVRNFQWQDKAGKNGQMCVKTTKASIPLPPAQNKKLLFKEIRTKALQHFQFQAHKNSEDADV